MWHYRYLSAIVSAALLAAGCSRAPSDAVIAAQIKARFFSDAIVKTSAVTVTVNHGDVTLAGTVSALDVELQALKLALATEGVRKLNDQIRVIPPPDRPTPMTEAPTPRHRETPAAVTQAATPAPETLPQDQGAAVPQIARGPAPSPTVLRVEVPPSRRVAAPQRPAETEPAYAAAVLAPVVGTIAPPRPEQRRTQFQRPVVLLAAGPLPPAALFEKWSLSLRQADPRARIDYEASGVFGRPQTLRQRTADLGVFDLPVSDELLLEVLKLRVLRFPAAVWGVVPVCNIGGALRALNFSGEVLAAVFSGQIARWDDPGIRALNPQAILPADQITVIHRSDASDETWLFTDYLSAISPGWKTRIGAAPSVTWPVGLGGAGNIGVTRLVSGTPNSIAYIDASFAIRNGLDACAVQNRSGRSIKASPDSLTAAAAGLAEAAPPDFNITIVNAPAPEAYPIASLLWLAVSDRVADPNKKDAMRSFLGWMMTRGQPDAVAQGFGAVPALLLRREQEQIARVR